MQALGKTACWVALSCLGVACGEQSDDVHESAVLMMPAVVADRLVSINQNDSHGYWLALGGSRPLARATERALPKKPILLEHRLDSQELLVLCQRPAGVDDGPEGMLVVLGPKGIDRRYELGTRYNKLIQSEDGRYVFLSSTAQASDDTSYYNPNDVSIIDLEKAPSSDNPRQRTLSSGAEALSAVFVSPPMRIGGETRRLAAVLFQSRLSLLDLNHPARRAWTAKLAAGSGASSTVGLKQAVFSQATLRVYLRGSVSSDVYVLQLAPRDAQDENENDFDFSLNQLGVGKATTAIELFPNEDGELLLATTVGHELLVVSADTSTVTTVPIGRPATMILPFSTGDEEVSQHAVLLKEGEPIVSFVDLRNVQARKDRNVEALTVPGNVATVTRLGDNRLLITHSTTGLSVIDLTDRTVSSIGSRTSLPPGATLVDAGRKRVWLVPRGESRVGYFDLDGMQPREIRLDSPVDSAALVGGPKVSKLVVVHPSLLGYVTLIDANEPSLKKARSLRGYLFDGILDRGED